MRSKVITAASLLVVTACASTPARVPVVGPRSDVSALAGEWVGEYWSLDTGRSGSILFRLEAGADSAAGDVLMIPPDQQHEHADGRHPGSEFIPISFVSVSGVHIRGRLAPYRDPSCGCMTETVFHGVLDDHTIEGTFTSRRIDSRAVLEGRWRARRTRGFASSPGRA